MIKPLLILILIFILRPGIHAQTCCSGGVPMASNIGLPISEKGNWQFSWSYDLNVLKTLKDGTTELNDNTRRRITNSMLSQVGYTISDRVSFDLFFSFIRQVRELTPIGQPANSDETSGIGDPVVLLKYRFFENFQAGIGLKAPLGSSDKRNNIGLRLGADLQPGSGSWDLVYWLNGALPLKVRRSMSVKTTFIYRSTGKNNDYLGSQIYEFGNELQAILGIADRLVLGTKTIDPSVSFKFRRSAADKTDADNTQLRDVPSTGGKWVFIKPAISLNLNSDFSVQANIELPLYADLVNTQVTPTYRINIGTFFTLRKRKILEP